MLVCKQGNCEKNGVDEICCKCCNIKDECNYVCYSAFFEDDECISEIEVEDDEDG